MFIYKLYLSNKTPYIFVLKLEYFAISQYRALHLIWVDIVLNGHDNPTLELSVHIPQLDVQSIIYSE